LKEIQKAYKQLKQERSFIPVICMLQRTCNSRHELPKYGI